MNPYKPHLDRAVTEQMEEYLAALRQQGRTASDPRLLPSLRGRADQAATGDGPRHRIDLPRALLRARRVLARRREEHLIPAQHVDDNSDIDLDILFEQLVVDFNDVPDCQEAGFVY